MRRQRGTPSGMPLHGGLAGRFLPTGMGAFMFACGLAAAQLPGREGEPAQAAWLSPYAHYTLEELLAVDISAPSKVEQPIREAPAIATLITREQIVAYGWRTLGDILLRQSGFAPSQDFERVTVSARGKYESWNGNNLRVLVDGVPFNLVSNGTAYIWEMFPLSMVESIEIVKGPGSALYGSNATNGVIAIRTRKPAESRFAEASVRAGGADTHADDLVGGRSYPWLSLLAGYDHSGTRGNVYASYDGSGRTAPDGALRRFEVNDRRSTDAAFLKLEGRGPLEGLSLQAHLAYWRFQTGQGWLFIVPDDRERAETNREAAWIAYRPPAWLDERLQMEFVAEWQRHEVDYRIKYLPDGFSLPMGDTAIALPNGAVEIVNFAPNDYFTRGQADYRFAEDMHILLGIENTVFIETEGGPHEANVDLNRGRPLLPFPGGEFREMRPVFESIIDKPVEYLGAYMQYCSGRILRRYFSATAGVRYDLQFFEYADLDQADAPIRSRYLDQFSPRLGLIFYALPDLAIKALAEHAFRAPAPTELFARNTLLGNSRTDQLQPVKMTAFTLAGDLRITRHLSLRTDGYYQMFANEIAFSASKNYSANLYSRTTTGIETDLLFDMPMGPGRSFGGFLNYSLARQLHGHVLDTAITPSERLTWAPEQVSNLGVSYADHGWHASAQGHYQGRVFRRPSDSFHPDGTPTFFSAYRPASVAPWITVDGLIGYGFNDGLRLQVQATNLLNQRGYLLKTHDYPFDYRIEGARVVATIELALQTPARSP